MTSERVTREWRQIPDSETIGDLVRGSPVARALQLIGDRWAFLILRDVFQGSRRFEDLRRRTGAPRATLTERLNSLVRQGILYRNPYQGAPTRFEYRLTDKGLDLYPWAVLVWTWESRWAGQHGLPAKLIHKPCGKEALPALICTYCQEPIDPHEVDYRPGPGLRHQPPTSPGYRRRDTRGPDGSSGVDTTLFHITDVIGDRWTGMIIAAMLFGLRRYDDLGTALGIASNVLADRLKRLVAAGVIQRQQYQSRPARYEYRLTDKGRDLYGSSVAMHDWANKWLTEPAGPALLLRHAACGKALRSQVICNVCRAPLDPHDITLQAGRRRPAAHKSSRRPRVKKAAAERFAR